MIGVSSYVCLPTLAFVSSLFLHGCVSSLLLCVSVLFSVYQAISSEVQCNLSPSYGRLLMDQDLLLAFSTYT